MTSISIIGAGFSGTLLALHLLRRCPNLSELRLIERQDSFGHGPAYATGNPHHLLNVPAGRMSAFHDRPEDFLEWLAADNAEHGAPPPSGSDFVPRGRYGNYIRHLLLQQVGEAAPLRLIRGTVSSLDANGPRLVLGLDRGRAVESDIVVLAIGNFPPEPPPGAPPDFLDSPCYRADPWAANTLAELDPEVPILLIGTGLTMVDMVLSLQKQGHRGPIHALSRRGLLPRGHLAHAGSAPPNDRFPRFPTRLLDLTRLVRAEMRRGVAAGGDWQPVIDTLRPFTHDIWMAFDRPEKERFLRHLRPWWDVHRHRMAPAVGDRIAASLAAGQLAVHAGRIKALECRGDHIRVAFARRGSGETVELDAGRVINCAGPGADYDRISDPLVRSLLSQGLIRPDPLKQGLDVTVNGAIKDRDGAISRRIFALGPITKGMFWEITAVPDIRRQCDVLATHLALLA